MRYWWKKSSRSAGEILVWVSRKTKIICTFWISRSNRGPKSKNKTKTIMVENCRLTTGWKKLDDSFGRRITDISIFCPIRPISFSLKRHQPKTENSVCCYEWKHLHWGIGEINPAGSFKNITTKLEKCMFWSIRPINFPLQIKSRNVW